MNIRLNLKRSLFIGFFSLFFLHLGLAQKKVELVLDIHPRDALVKIGEEVYDLGQLGPRPSVMLESEVQSIAVWAPGRTVFREELPLTTKDSIIVFSRNISKHYTNEYLNYQNNVKKHRTKQLGRWIILGAAIGSNIWYNAERLSQRRQLFKRQEELDTYFFSYRNAITSSDAIETYNTYSSNYRKFEKHRKRHNILTLGALPLLVGSTLISIRMVKVLKKGKSNTFPSFQEQSPFSNLFFQSPSLEGTFTTPSQFSFVLQF